MCRGSAYDSLGQYERAVADYTKALELDLDSGDVGLGGNTGRRHAKAKQMQSMPSSPLK